MRTIRKQHGAVLADLLVGLMVGSIVLAAAATMADAMSHGKRATEQISRTSNYLAQVHTRLVDMVMRAESVQTRDGGGVLLTYFGGRTAELYADPDDTGRLIIQEDGAATSFLSDPLQTSVSVLTIDSNRVVITLDISENGATQSYLMTATRRGRE